MKILCSYTNNKKACSFVQEHLIFIISDHVGTYYYVSKSLIRWNKFCTILTLDEYACAQMSPCWPAYYWNESCILILLFALFFLVWKSNITLNHGMIPGGKQPKFNRCNTCSILWSKIQSCEKKKAKWTTVFALSYNIVWRSDSAKYKNIQAWRIICTSPVSFRFFESACQKRIRQSKIGCLFCS